MTEKAGTGGVVTVAELLARNGQESGTGGRAHRRRAREGGITVAELTGEIPVVQEPEAEPEAPAAEAPEPEAADEQVAVGEPEAAEEPEPVGEPEAAEEPQPEALEAPEPATRAYSTLDAVADAGPQSPREFASTTAFPAVMSPLAGSIMSADAPAAPPIAEAPAEYRAPEQQEVEGSEPEAAAPERGAVRQWLSLIAQAVVGVAVGAALFIGFEKLWDSLPYVALILAILVILALVAVVRILRKTDDIVSMLTAVVVGVIVTIGPLAFVLSTS